MKTRTAPMQASTTAAPEMTDPAIATLPFVAFPNMHLRCPARPSRNPVTPKAPATKKVDGNRPNRTPTTPRISAVGPRAFLGRTSGLTRKFYPKAEGAIPPRHRAKALRGKRLTLRSRGLYLLAEWGGPRVDDCRNMLQVMPEGIIAAGEQPHRREGVVGHCMEIPRACRRLRWGARDDADAHAARPGRGSPPA